MTDDFDARLTGALDGYVDTIAGPQIPPTPFRVPEPSRSHRTLRTALTAAAAAVLVAALAVTVAVVVHRQSSPAANRIGIDPHYTLTVERVEQALADIPVPNGGHRSDTSPDPRLDSAPAGPANGPRGIHRVGWWTAPSGEEAALRFYGSHPAPGFSYDGSGTINGLSFLSFARADDSATEEWTVFLSVVTTGDRVVVRADVFAVWAPTRTAASKIVDPSTVVIILTVRYGKAPTLTRTLRAKGAGRLAGVINELRPYPKGGAFSCAPKFPGYYETMRFSTPRGVVDVRLDDTGRCGLVTLTRSGQRPLSLESGTLAAAVLRVLGLPANYGYGR